MTMATHYVVFYTATAGLNDEHLGSDEQDILLIYYLVMEAASAKVVLEQRNILRVGSGDENENLLSEQAREAFHVTEEDVKNGLTLEGVIEAFHSRLASLVGTNPCSGSVSLVTDGQLHLRQVLLPQSSTKGVLLYPYYNFFYDLRKEFRDLYHTEDLKSVPEMLLSLGQTPEEEGDLAARTVRGMSRVISVILQGGHRLRLPETINSRLEPGICSKGEEVDSSCIVRARGLPWQSSDQDIAKFFMGLNIAKGGVALCLSQQGRRNGEALVRFVSNEHREMALRRHKHHIGNRYIEVYKATGEDFINVAGGNNNEAQQFLSRGGQVIIRMRGLPYDCTARQVVDFFESDSGEGVCHILDAEEGVLFVRKPDGRATGDAFVLFAGEDDAARALSKHREIIGSRYIELFRSTTAEVQQVLNRTMDPRTYEQQQPLISHLPQLPLVPQPMIGTGPRKDCIRLRGLPYEAQVEHILEFLGEHSKNIVLRGVHLMYNPQNQPNGEAIIQMESEQSAYLAAQQKHNQYMTFGKKQRYIEVFQCLGDDINLYQSGGILVNRPIMSAGGTVIPAPFGAFPLGPAPPYFSVGTVAPRLPAYPSMACPAMFYWAYPSPPVSPGSAFYPAIAPALAPAPASPPTSIIATECIHEMAHVQANGEPVATM